MTILDRIVTTKRDEVEAARRVRPLDLLQRQVQDAPPARDFFAAVTAGEGGAANLIAELKKASPSAGVIVADFDPVAIAHTYAAHGAAALSVLTDETYFQGHLSLIRRVKEAVSLPVLRKEFIIDEYQVVESRAACADAILLISEILSVDQVAQFHATARELGMAVLVEGHSKEALLGVVDRLGPPVERNYLLGINNRDLRVQKTDVHTTVKIASALPQGTPFVSESGLHTRADVETVAGAGACAVLVGESLLRSPDIGKKIDELLGN